MVLAIVSILVQKVLMPKLGSCRTATLYMVVVYLLLRLDAGLLVCQKDWNICMSGSGKILPCRVVVCIFGDKEKNKECRLSRT